MFGSAILDVGIGIILAFLGVSLATSAITEAIASFFKLRQRNLVAGLQALLNDPNGTGLAKSLLNHALVNPLGNGLADSVKALKERPAYIDADHFAIAFLDIVKRREGAAAPLRQAVDDIGNEQIKRTLHALMAQAGDKEDKLRAAIGHWFDASMERVGGLYKRRTQCISFWVAFFIAAALNVDALRITTELWKRPAEAALLAAAAGHDAELLAPPSSLQKDTGQPVQGAGQTTEVNKTDKAAGAQHLIDDLDKSALIGWNGFAGGERDPFEGGKIPLGTRSAGFIFMVLGWFVVAGAALFGAPFWFDALQNITQIRGVGGGKGIQQRPQEVQAAQPAAPAAPG